MRIFDEEGKQLGLHDIAKHFIETYPEDIFMTGPYPIPEIRELFKKIIEIHETNIKKRGKG
jgi:hypothetical protein